MCKILTLKPNVQFWSPVLPEWNTMQRTPCTLIEHVLLTTLFNLWSLIVVLLQMIQKFLQPIVFMLTKLSLKPNFRIRKRLTKHGWDARSILRKGSKLFYYYCFSEASCGYKGIENYSVCRIICFQFFLHVIIIWSVAATFVSFFFSVNFLTVFSFTMIKLRSTRLRKPMPICLYTETLSVTTCILPRISLSPSL